MFDPIKVRKVAAFAEALTGLYEQFGYAIPGEIRLVSHSDFEDMPFVLSFSHETLRYEMGLRA